MNTDPHYTIFSTSPLRHLSLFNTQQMLFYVLHYKGLHWKSNISVRPPGNKLTVQCITQLRYLYCPFQASCPQAGTHLTWHVHKALWLAAFIIPPHNADRSVQTPPTCHAGSAIKSELVSLVSYCTRCGLQTRALLDTSQTRRPDKNREVAVMMCKYAGLRRFSAHSCWTRVETQPGGKKIRWKEWGTR